MKYKYFSNKAPYLRMESKVEYKLPKTFLGRLWKKYVVEYFRARIIIASPNSRMSNYKSNSK